MATPPPKPPKPTESLRTNTSPGKSFRSRPVAPPKPPSGGLTSSDPTSNNRPPLPQKPTIPPKTPPVIQREVPPSKPSSTTKRISIRNPGLENVLLHRGSGPPSNAPPTPPSPETSSPPIQDKKKGVSKLRPKKTSKVKGKSSQVFGTLPRLMSKDKYKTPESNNAAESPPVLEGSISSPSFAHRPISSQTESSSPQEETQTKWKRGAEAEAILKLINESKNQSEQGSTTNNTNNDKGSSSNIPVIAPEAIDAEEIMKILGLEEPGIKLPKHTSDEEKALDPMTELQFTERNFIADLGLLNETFVKPVRNGNILPGSVIEALAINIERLISLHRELYKNFLADDSLFGIATTFSDSLIAEMERLYTVYMGHYENSLALFHEKRDNVTQFRKYLTKREEVTDKSIPNLLVTPVQRVCKYELMLSSIKKTCLKQADPNDKQIIKDAELLQTKINLLNVTLQNVDKRRAAADNWDKINQLEKSLLLSESLSKVGRVILLKIETIVRVYDEERQFQLVLFNDQLIRTKIPKTKKSKARLLDSIPLNQLQIIDIKQQELMHQSTLKSDIPERYSFYIVPNDPRLPIWTVHFLDEKIKYQWLDNLSPRVLSFERFCDSWGIKSTKDECLVAADGGRWPQEYVNECRLFITTNHLCILWKMFGIEERELVHLQLLGNTQSTTFGKEKALKIHSTGWKQDYTFTSLQLHEHTESILAPLIQQTVRNQIEKKQIIYQTNNPFLLSHMEWNSIWSAAKSITFQSGDNIIDSSSAHPFLYQLVSGTVMANDSPPVLITKSGTIFGVKSFFEDFPPAFMTTAQGNTPVTVLQLQRDTLFAICDAAHLTKFFATLAKISSVDA